jgi:chromosome segregation ATPase
VKTLVQTLVFSSLLLVLTTNSRAEIKTYQVTDETGLNKKERIDTVETYLSTLSTSLQKMEAKLDENAKKIMSLDQAIKDVQLKESKLELAERQTQSKTAAKKTDKKTDADEAEKPVETTGDIELKVGEKTQKSEIDKLKADVLALKNQDIEKLKTNLEELSDTVKAIQATLKK